MDNAINGSMVDDVINGSTVDDMAESAARNADEGASGGNLCKVANSFSADTLVTTSDGKVPISEVEIGDTVIAYDPDTGDISEYEVTHLWVHDDDEIVILTIDGETIETTPWHPFYVTDEGWVEAGDLVIGDEIVSLDGSNGTVEAVVIEERTETMYNLTVEEAHTFFVGDGQWLVHNTACNWEPGKPPKAKGGVYRFEDQTSEGQPYFGKGDLRTRLDKHIYKKRTQYSHVEYMILPQGTDRIPLEVGSSFAGESDEFVQLAAERVLMYNASDGNLDVLANDIWQLNNETDVARLRELFANPPSYWPDDLKPKDNGFFRILPAKTPPKG